MAVYPSSTGGGDERPKKRPEKAVGTEIGGVGSAGWYSERARRIKSMFSGVSTDDGKRCKRWFLLPPHDGDGAPQRNVLVGPDKSSCIWALSFPVLDRFTIPQPNRMSRYILNRLIIS